MYKLGDLIISGMEVYAAPTPAQDAAAPRDSGLRATLEGRGSPLLRGLLLHSLAVGAFPLPWLRGGR